MYSVGPRSKRCQVIPLSSVEIKTSTAALSAEDKESVNATVLD